MATSPCSGSFFSPLLPAAPHRPFPTRTSKTWIPCDPAWTVLFVNDDSRGIFVFTRSLEHPMPPCRPGDIVEIEGSTARGEFAPTIAAHQLTIKQRGGLPHPRRISLDELLSGQEDSQFIEISGIVRSVGHDAKHHLALEIVNARERIPAFAKPREPQQPGLRLLVAEDNVVNQKVAAGLLARRGHDVVIASNGLEAVAAWEQGGFDAIFMDVQMPEMDGFEATTTIRAAEAGGSQHTPIIAMTAHAMTGDRERCLAAGMDEYVTKPISISEIDRVLARIRPAPQLASIRVTSSTPRPS